MCFYFTLHEYISSGLDPVDEEPPRSVCTYEEFNEDTKELLKHATMHNHHHHHHHHNHGASDNHGFGSQGDVAKMNEEFFE